MSKNFILKSLHSLSVTLPAVGKLSSLHLRLAHPYTSSPYRSVSLAQNSENTIGRPLAAFMMYCNSLLLVSSRQFSKSCNFSASVTGRPVSNFAKYLSHSNSNLGQCSLVPWKTGVAKFRSNCIFNGSPTHGRPIAKLAAPSSPTGLICVPPSPPRACGGNGSHTLKP